MRRISGDPSPSSEARASGAAAAVPAGDSPEHAGLLLLDAVDAAVRDRVLVTGALPPAGRDLDLVVRAPEREAVESVLRRGGFLPRGRDVVPVRTWTMQWALFSGADVYPVDLNPAERWGLPAAELDALFAEATPLEQRTNLARPAPHHVLLLVARRVIAGDGRLVEKRRARIDGALAEDPDAWALARRHAAAWGLRYGLDALERAYVSGAPVPRVERVRARGDLAASAGGPAWRVNAAARRLDAGRPRRPRIVAFSGLDGAGKSSHARALEQTLERLGVRTTVVWKPLGHNELLHKLRRAAKRALRRRAVRRAGAAEAAPANPAKAFREQSELLTQVWVTLVALANAFFYRRAVLRHGATGGVVIFDRYVLDSIAQIRFFYGRERSFRLQHRLIELLCPKPVAAYFLDVPPEVVMSRKEIQYGLAELREEAVLYREEAERTGVRRLDGERPKAELREEVAREVWTRLA